MDETKYETETCAVEAEKKQAKKEQVAEEKGGKGLAVFLLILSMAFMGLRFAAVIFKWDPEGAHGGGGSSGDAGLSGGLSASPTN